MNKKYNYPFTLPIDNDINIHIEHIGEGISCIWFDNNDKEEQNIPNEFTIYDDEGKLVSPFRNTQSYAISKMGNYKIVIKRAEPQCEASGLERFLDFFYRTRSSPKVDASSTQTLLTQKVALLPDEFGQAKQNLDSTDSETNQGRDVVKRSSDPTLCSGAEESKYNKIIITLTTRILLCIPAKIDRTISVIYSDNDFDN